MECHDCQCDVEIEVGVDLDLPCEDYSCDPRIEVRCKDCVYGSTIEVACYCEVTSCGEVKSCGEVELEGFGWEHGAKRLYEELNPGKSWYEFPAGERDRWVRALRGL